MLTIYCRNRLETQIERKREKNEDFLSFCECRLLRWLRCRSQAGAHSFILMWRWQETLKNWGEHKLAHKVPHLRVNIELMSLTFWVMSRREAASCPLPLTCCQLPPAPASRQRTAAGQTFASSVEALIWDQFLWRRDNASVVQSTFRTLLCILSLCLDSFQECVF